MAEYIEFKQRDVYTYVVFKATLFFIGLPIFDVLDKYIN